ncbi:hypothetical protein CRG98_001064 [Punica granatum]|uniref:Uncharacterized protein n=1 Tax=Punica granatum TaxID=22663 RepID=A0A2I0LCZ9_PUNGR|nr:hypothetical protein CRG98_001064 [Punica granatum]
MIGICVVEEGKSERGDPSPFVIEYVPTEATVGFAGVGAPPAPFVINIPVQEPYSDGRVPWTYEEDVPVFVCGEPMGPSCIDRLCRGTSKRPSKASLTKTKERLT